MEHAHSLRHIKIKDASLYYCAITINANIYNTRTSVRWAIGCLRIEGVIVGKYSREVGVIMEQVGRATARLVIVSKVAILHDVVNAMPSSNSPYISDKLLYQLLGILFYNKHYMDRASIFFK